MGQLKVFLCYAKEDKPVVYELFNRLINYPWLDVWLDDKKLLPGHDWRMNIEAAVESSDVVIVCLSNKSVDKEGYIQKELRLVLNVADEKPEGAIFVIPLRLDNCQVPRRLQGWQYVDFFPKSHENIAFDKVMESLKFQSQKLNIPKVSDVQSFQPQIQNDLSDTLQNLLDGEKSLSNFLDKINVRFEDNEKNIIYQKHWLALIKLTAIPSIILWVMLILLINGINYLLFSPSAEFSPIGVLLWIFIVNIVIPWWTFQYQVWKNEVYKITSDQILHISKVPFGTRYLTYIQLENIIDVQYKYKGAIGHQMNLGTVYITADSGKMTLSDVYNPSRIQSDIKRYQMLRNNPLEQNS